MKKYSFISLLMTLTFLLSACSNQTSEKSNALGQSADTQQTEIKLWLTGPLFEDYLKEVIPVFEQQNPYIKVNAETIDWGSYQQKILTAVAGGIAPDVVSVFATDTAPFAEKNVFVPLDDYVDTSLFIENYLEASYWDDQLYSLPIAMTVRPLYYRMDMLQEAGLENPPQSWEELRETAKAVTVNDEKGNIERVGFWVPTNHPYKTYQVWLTFLLNNGGKVFDEDGTPIFNSPEGIAAAELFHNLVKVDHVDTPGTIQTDDKDMMQDKVAMFLSNSAIRGFSEEFSLNVGVAIPPYNAKPVVEAAGEVIGITSTCKNPGAAAKLIMFLTTNVEASNAYAKLEGGIPATLEAQKSDYVQKNRLLRDMAEMANEYGVPLPKHPNWLEISTIITSALDQVVIDEVPAEQALNDAVEKVKQIS